MRTSGLGHYIDTVRAQSEHWGVPQPLVLMRLAMARLLFGRGPAEFDRYGFATKSPWLWRSYVKHRGLWQLQSSLLSEEARRYEEDKIHFAQHCAEHGLPTIPLLAVVAPGTGGDQPHAAQPPRITSAAALETLFAALGDYDGFAKPLGGGQGYGAFGFAIRDGVWQPKRRMPTVQALFDLATTGPFSESGYLLQPRVAAHPALLPFMPGPGLGTVRINSFLRRTGELTLLTPTIKFPADGADCDNSRLGSLFAPVALETGIMGAAIGTTSGSAVTDTMDTHPTTGARVTGTQLPCWPEVIDLVTRAARAFPMLPALGWDVAITPTGPLLVETNWRFSPKFLEVQSQRGWAADFRELYETLAPSVVNRQPAGRTT